MICQGLDVFALLIMVIMNSFSFFSCGFQSKKKKYKHIDKKMPGVITGFHHDLDKNFKLPVQQFNTSSLASFETRIDGIISLIILLTAAKNK